MGSGSVRGQVIQTQQVPKADSTTAQVQPAAFSFECLNKEARSLGLLQLERKRERDRYLDLKVVKT